MEGRANVRCAFGPDASAVHRDEALGNRQAEPGAAELLGHRGVTLAELLEYRLHLIRTDADASVLYDVVKVPVRRREPNVHPPLARELDGIANQVEKHLEHAPAVTEAVPDFTFDIGVQREALSFRHRP